MERLQTTIQAITSPSREWRERALERLRQQARPAGSLGVLEDLSARLAGIFKTLDVRLDRKVIVTCAGDHGICEEGVSLFPSEVTPQMVYNFVRGGASINVLAKHAGAEVRVADLGVAADFESDLPIFHKKIAKGTRNFAVGPAMTREEAVASLVAGIDIVAAILAEGPVQLFGTGDMGIGNTTPSTAIIAAYSGMGLDALTGRGTGVDDEGLQRKKAAIRKGLKVNQPDPDDALDVLAKVGGFEIGGIAGMILACAYHRKPVVVDGFISTAGALVAATLCPAATGYMFAGHCSEELSLIHISEPTRQ